MHVLAVSALPPSLSRELAKGGKKQKRSVLMTSAGGVGGWWGDRDVEDARHSSHGLGGRRSCTAHRPRVSTAEEIQVFCGSHMQPSLPTSE